MQALVGLRQFLGYDTVPANFDVIGDLAYQPVQVNLEDLQAKRSKIGLIIAPPNWESLPHESQYRLWPRLMAK